MYRRMVALMPEHKIELIYWDRQLKIEAVYSIPKGVKTYRIAIRAVLGQWFRRLIPLIRFLIRAFRLLNSIRPDAIHCGGLDMLLIGWLYKKLFAHGLKLIYEVADLPNITYNQKAGIKARWLKVVFRTLEKHLCKAACLLIVTSPYFWSEYYSHLVPKSKIMFIPNAPEKRLFGAFKKRIHENFVIGFIGLIRYPDQIKMLIDATENLQGVKVLLAGEGKDYEKIKTYCERRSHVVFYGPYNYETEVVKLYSEIDCVYAVYDTRIDNVRVALPNKLYEAIVCELPIIAAEGTALGKFVTEEGIGFAVPDNDVDILRKVILRMVTDRCILDKFRRRLQELKPDYYAESAYDTIRVKYRELEIRR